MIKAVIFDMDGLILDTEKLLVKYWCQAANEAGFPMQREHALNIRSLARKFAIPYLQGLFGKEFDYVKIRSRRMELMKQHIAEHGLETKPGITELLDYLDSRGIPAAIATATDIQRTEDYLGQVGLLGRFSRIVCAAMVENGKPKPDIYLYAAEQLGLPANECMALEDSPNGVRSASDAGCVTVMVPDLTQPDEEISMRIWAKADSLADVPKYIEMASHRSRYTCKGCGREFQGGSGGASVVILCPYCGEKAEAFSEFGFGAVWPGRICSGNRVVAEVRGGNEIVVPGVPQHIMLTEKESRDSYNRHMEILDIAVRKLKERGYIRSQE